MLPWIKAHDHNVWSPWSPWIYEYCLPATTHALLLLAAQDKPKLSPNQGHMSQVVLSIMNE